MIREVASLNEDITNVTNFNIDFTGDSLTIAFKVETIYGKGEMTVDV